jgi:hypothetical protein
MSSHTSNENIVNRFKQWNKNKKYSTIIAFYEERIINCNDSLLIYYYLRSLIKEEEYKKANNFISKLNFKDISEDYTLDQLILKILEQEENFDYSAQDFFNLRYTLLNLSEDTYTEKLVLDIYEDERIEDYWSDLHDEEEKRLAEEQKNNSNHNISSNNLDKISHHSQQFKSSVLCGGSVLFPEYLFVDNQKVIWEKGRLLGKDCKTIQIDKITTININTSITGGHIIIHSNGFGFIHASNFSNSDILEIKALLENYQNQ